MPRWYATQNATRHVWRHFDRTLNSALRGSLRCWKTRLHAALSSAAPNTRTTVQSRPVVFTRISTFLRQASTASFRDAVRRTGMFCAAQRVTQPASCSNLA